MKTDPGSDARGKTSAGGSLLYQQPGTPTGLPPFLGSSLGENPQRQRVSGDEGMETKAWEDQNPLSRDDRGEA